MYITFTETTEYIYLGLDYINLYIVPITFCKTFKFRDTTKLSIQTNAATTFAPPLKKYNHIFFSQRRAET